MGSRLRPTRILCVNCNICVNNMLRHPVLELNTKVVTLITNWVYPTIITDDDVVCESCREQAFAAANQNMNANCDQQAGLSYRGHTNVCLLCGRSILRRRCHKILKENPSALHQSMIDIIKKRVALRQVTAPDRVCHACWLRIKRQALRGNTVDQGRSTVKPVASVENINPVASVENIKQEVSLENNLQEPVLEDPLEENQPPVSNTVDQGRSQPVASVENIKQEASLQNNLQEPVLEDPIEEYQPPVSVDVASITLPNYRRAANSSSHCVFHHCKRTTRHRIDDKLRAIVISNHKYYLPKHARVCSHHLKSNSWDSLFKSENSIDKFTAEQIEHVFSFVNNFSPKIDFENLEEMEDHIFEYWMGVTKATFNIILNRVPRITSLRRGRLGLAVLLLKMKNGDSGSKLSSLVKIPRRTLEGLMHEVKKILEEDFVPLHLGVNSITDLLHFTAT